MSRSFPEHLIAELYQFASECLVCESLYQHFLYTFCQYKILLYTFRQKVDEAYSINDMFCPIRRFERVMIYFRKYFFPAYLII